VAGVIQAQSVQNGRSAETGLEIKYLFADTSNVDGSIQVKYRGSSANDEFIDSGHSAYGLAESEFAPPVADYAGPPLVKLPLSPFLSFGGYFNYEGWPDQQRFMELDEALRRTALESPQSCRPNAQRYS
jgi:hypothetical protein